MLRLCEDESEAASYRGLSPTEKDKLNGEPGIVIFSEITPLRNYAWVDNCDITKHGPSRPLFSAYFG